ncbi:MerR family transcriptional regulator [Caldimonas tepidiphila]|uniref:MerR family transcriptional regulator n=1 Tax=Caldimonas tepidiphila TaxID=2315841 RepID=UPI001F0B9647|nr:MerR family transcriptional regulator [Caldimonas tepidiphila]
MSMPDPPPVLSVPDGEDTRPRYRSGAVARMLRMPVATLRIWERRYRVASPATTPSGHRLYSAADVRRLALLKQLTDHGHAIGALAALEMEQLRQVAATHASTLAQAGAPQAARPWQVVVVGAALERRLRRPALLRGLGRPVQVCAVFGEPGEAAQAPEGSRADALLVHAPGLHAAGLDGLQAAARRWSVARSAVLYGYAASAACEAFAAAGTALLRDAQDDGELARWLRDLAEPPAPPAPLPPGFETGRPAARRYDDATLVDFAGLSSTLACECPRHVAGLLMQLSHFEAYSAECERLGPSDAALHAYLQQVTGAARSLFESALERIAIHEGLVLPR